jgi:hypothetical protein
VPITSQYFAGFNRGNLGNLWHMEMYKAHWEDPSKIDQWPLSDIIDIQERFCHNVRNFIDYLLKFRMFYCSCWGHAFDRAIDLKKLRVKGGISPRWQLQKPPTPFLHTKTPKEDVYLIYQESIQKLLQFNLNLCSNNLFRLIQEWSDEYLIGAQECHSGSKVRKTHIKDPLGVMTFEYNLSASVQQSSSYLQCHSMERFLAWTHILTDSNPAYHRSASRGWHSRCKI